MKKYVVISIILVIAYVAMIAYGYFSGKTLSKRNYDVKHAIEDDMKAQSDAMKSTTTADGCKAYPLTSMTYTFLFNKPAGIHTTSDMKVVVPGLCDKGITFDSRTADVV